MTPKHESQLSDPTELLTELTRRPALNGGFQKLQRQQTRQMSDLRHIKRRVRSVEEWQTRIDRRFTWALGMLASIATAVLGRGAYDLLMRVVH